MSGNFILSQYHYRNGFGFLPSRYFKIHVIWIHTRDISNLFEYNIVCIIRPCLWQKYPQVNYFEEKWYLYCICFLLAKTIKSITHNHFKLKRLYTKCLTRAVYVPISKKKLMTESLYAFWGFFWQKNHAFSSCINSLWITAFKTKKGL